MPIYVDDNGTYPRNVFLRVPETGAFGKARRKVCQHSSRKYTVPNPKVSMTFSGFGVRELSREQVGALSGFAGYGQYEVQEELLDKITDFIRIEREAFNSYHKFIDKLNDFKVCPDAKLYEAFTLLREIMHDEMRHAMVFQKIRCLLS